VHQGTLHAPQKHGFSSPDSAAHFVEIPFRLAEEVDPVLRLLTRHASVPMALADACLVRMAEQHAKGTVMTLDTDFHIFRKQGRQVVPTIMPEVARRRT
jgi:predicted nucleic acid-binding protein